MSNKIIIAGGTGFLGQSIIRRLLENGYEIIVLTRGKKEHSNGINYVHWDAKSTGAWIHKLEGSKAIINLVGKSVNCRYTATNKREIIDSRVDATNAIGQAIASLKRPPEVWINAGSVAIFGDAGSEIKDEHSTTGTGFPAEVCKHWEAAFNSHRTLYTKKVLLRIGLVFQKDIGLLQPFLKLAKFGFGNRFGNGNQYISWIHEKDFTHIVLQAIERKDYEGVIHAASPEPVTNKTFFKLLRSAVNIPFGIPLPAWLLQIGGQFAGTEAGLLLAGRRVVSKVLVEKDFVFSYPALETALDDLLHRETEAEEAIFADRPVLN